MEGFNDSSRRPLANVFQPDSGFVAAASATALVIVIGYITWIGIYRLYFSPIAKFPGPKLAALTGLYEAYFDLVPKGGGQFPFAIKRMHEKYGPIVRINPDELHIDDPDFFDTLYPTSKPYDKLKRLENRFGIPGATFSTARHELHKIRRAAISPFFAKSKVREQTGDIQALMNTISRRLTTEYAGTGRVLNLHDVWRCFAADNIMDLVFGSPLDLHLSPEFRAPFTGAITRVTNWSHVTRYLPILGAVTDSLPYWLAKRLFPPFEPIIAYREEMSRQTATIRASHQATGGNEKPRLGQTGHATVFHEMLASSLPIEELEHKRMQHEAESLIGAGLETTAWTLALGSFYILHNPEVYAKLQSELTIAIPDATQIPPWATLETLPYLTAIVKETLRMGMGVIERLVRINCNPANPWVYNGTVIPANVAVSMDQYHMLMNERVFPDPTAFRPERWLGDPRGPDGIHPLTHYMTVFGRGTRMCLGLNLAYSELYIGHFQVATPAAQAADLLIPTPRHHGGLNPRQNYDSYLSTATSHFLQPVLTSSLSFHLAEMDDDGMVPTPPASAGASPKDFDLSAETLSQYPAVKHAALPADGAGHDTFSFKHLVLLLAFVPAFATWKLCGGYNTLVVALFTLLVPVVAAFWYVASCISPPINEKIQNPGRPVEEYITFKNELDRDRYWGRHKIPMGTFTKMYFDGEVDFNGDALEILEWRYDWASWRFTREMTRFVVLTWLPEVISSYISPQERQLVEDQRGSDFYSWFLGPRLAYTSGIISDMNIEETLEELQDNKLAAVCEKIDLQPGDRLLDIGCGWGSLVTFASVNYGALATGLTIDPYQADLGNWRLQSAEVSETQSRICNRAYEGPDEKYDKIVCLQSSGQEDLKVAGFFERCYEMLADDGVFHVEITASRRAWQYEDLVWGLFLKRHVIPWMTMGWDLGRYVTSLEEAGFEIQSVDNIGQHYSATLWRWYKNWTGNRDKITAKYGEKSYRG
ncbi:Cytochrome P450 monooxygenase [Colletotrichum sp. SAR11_239]|nr:Cytochrome P450 monooxygenase [Colletotrichum sp. SAR11_239]